MKSSKVALRELRFSDKTQLAQLANNKNVWDNVRDYFPHPYSEKDAETFIQSQSKDPSTMNFAIEYNESFCGVIGLILQKDVYRKSAETGYWIGEPYWGNNIATKAIALIIKFGFDELELMRIYAGVFEYNLASMKVLEKNGFQKEGIAKKAVFKNGGIWDEHRFAILKKA